MLHKFFRKTPIAWLQVKREKTRLAVAVAGIAFADLLIFFQLGLMESVYKSATGIHSRLRGDLYLVNSLSDNMQTIKPFSRARLSQARRVDGVADISSLYVGYGEWLNLDNRRISRVQVYGFNPDKPAINLPEVNLQLNKLKLLNYVLQDRSARPGLGDVMGKLQQSQFFSAQVNRFQTKVCGLFTMGIPFFADGNLIVSDSTFLQLFPDRLPNQIDVGIIVLKQGTVIEKAQINLKAQLPNDVLVLTKEEFIQQERDYWERVNPIGLVFGFGTFVGFLVGTVIVYQILYSDVSDHLPEYATLKAIGYSDLYFVGVLFQEALLLGCIGFIFGFITTLGLYALIYQATLLPVFMSLNRAILVLALTLVMCTLSGALAIQKLQYADPADIF